MIGLDVDDGGSDSDEDEDDDGGGNDEDSDGCDNDEDDDDEWNASIDLKQVSTAGVTRNQFDRQITFDGIFPSC